MDRVRSSFTRGRIRFLIRAVQSDSSTCHSIIFTPASYVERLDVAALFPRDQPLEVEIGAGDGSFLIQWATQNPDRNFIGLERLLGRLTKIEKKGGRAGLINLRALRLEAAYFTDYLLPHESVSAFHIYFPDPWPKIRHRRHRLINEGYTEVLRRALIMGGVVYLRTDDQDYFAQMTESFAANRAFASIETPTELAGVTTDFEREFNARGIITQRAAYRRDA